MNMRNNNNNNIFAKDNGIERDQQASVQVNVRDSVLYQATVHR
jgi:hypothetical protein